MAGLSDLGYELQVEQQKLLSRLVQHTLHIRPDNSEYVQGFDKARYILRHHPFAETNPRVVEEGFESLEQRLIEHSQVPKAKLLLRLRKQLLDIPLATDTIEVHHRLLSALWNLYQNPLTSSLPQHHEEAPAPAEEELSELSSWDEEPCMYRSDSGGSVLSEEASTYAYFEPETEDSFPGASQRELPEAGLPVDWHQEACLYTRLYWKSNLLQQRDQPVAQGTTERSLGIQVLHMLQGSTQPGHAFTFDERACTFRATDRVHVGHLSVPSLAALLQSFANAGSQAARVHAFVRRARSLSTLSDASPPPLHGLLTMQALADGVAEQLLAIAARLQAAEPMVHSMHWDDFDGTVMLNLQQALQGVMQHQALLDHVATIGTFSGNAKATVLLQLFSVSVRPLMNILDTWLGQGQLIDPTSEFFIVPGEELSPAYDSFWGEAFQMRETTSDGLPCCPSFLQAQAQRILDAGKAQMLLLHMPQAPDMIAGAQAAASMQAWSDWIDRQGHCSLWTDWLQALHTFLQEYGAMETSSTAVATDKHQQQRASRISRDYHAALGPPLDDIIPLMSSPDQPFALRQRLIDSSCSITHDLTGELGSQQGVQWEGLTPQQQSTAGQLLQQEPCYPEHADVFLCGEDQDRWLRDARTIDLPPVTLLTECCIAQPILHQVTAIEAELLKHLRGDWGLRQQLEALCNLFLLGAPAMQGFADALTAAGCLHEIPVHSIVSLLQEHLPCERGWHGVVTATVGTEKLPDAEDILVEVEELQTETAAVAEAAVPLLHVARLRLTCRLRWSLAAIISLDAQEQWNTVLSLLLQLRMAERALLHAVVNQHSSTIPAGARQGLALRLRMLHAVRAIHSFTQQRLLNDLLPATQKALAEATSLQQLTEVAMRLAALLPCLLQGNPPQQDNVAVIADDWERAWNSFARFLTWPSHFTSRIQAAKLAFDLGIVYSQI
ncbi:hypothetical protein WJX73_007631 [Symbiochloris irregularis]|uniref:Gamma-tubulin complex component n=1 Tax=Symbiochloris irregularis TaxID=706552 RepID=A0AAW1P902_9CHLO